MKKKHHKKRSSRFRKIVGKLHLWVGLSVGAIIFIVSVTGAMYAFKDEVEAAFLGKYYHHGEKNTDAKKILPIKEMERLVQSQNKENFPVNWVEIPLDKSQTYRFIYYERNSKAWNYFDEFPVFKTYFVDPFNGKILGSYDQKNTFFNIVKYIHWSFLLNSEWGKWVVGIPTLLFLGMFISGIVLWWPRNRNARKQRFWFQWKNVKSWRRRNYDLHSIVGFYASLTALVATVTGLFYAFIFVQTMLYFVFSGGKTTMTDLSQYKNIAPISAKTNSVYDAAIATTERLYPHAASYNLSLGNQHLGGYQSASLSVFVKELPYSFHKSSLLIFDENSGKLLRNFPHGEKNFGEKFVAANYDLHVGDILGIWGKILAFISSLACASLPITGFLVWWGRQKSKDLANKKARV